MSSIGTEFFTSERIARQAECNLTAVILGTIVFLKHHGLSVSEWAMFLGQRFVPDWTDLHGLGSHEAALRIALNLLSAGADVQSVSGDATVTIALQRNWPTPEQLAFFRVSEADAELFLDVFTPLVNQLGFHFTWTRRGKSLMLSVAGADTGQISWKERRSDAI